MCSNGSEKLYHKLDFGSMKNILNFSRAIVCRPNRNVGPNIIPYKIILPTLKSTTYEERKRFYPCSQHSTKNIKTDLKFYPTINGSGTAVRNPKT